MTRDELRNLLSRTKALYPRFEAVEKEGGVFRITTETIEAWYRTIGWMEAEKADRILDEHMASEAGDKTPTIRTWTKAGRPDAGKGVITATLDRQHGVLIWQPGDDGKVYEKQIAYNEKRGVWTTEDGYDYITIEELKEGT